MILFYTHNKFIFVYKNEIQNKSTSFLDVKNCAICLQIHLESYERGFRRDQLTCANMGTPSIAKNIATRGKQIMLYFKRVASFLKKT